MNKKILITGAGGYIGSVATYLFLQKGYEVISIDNYSTGYRQPLELLQKQFGSDKFRFYEADLKNDVSHIFEKEKDIEAVIDYAALCNVDESISFPERYFANDTWGSLHLVETMLKFGIDKLIFSSTCAVYGESHYVPLDEKHPIHPISPYGEAKRMAEVAIEWYSKLKNLHYIFLRYFNVCGASDDGQFGDSKKPSFHLMQNVVRATLGIERFRLTCPEVDTPDKTPIRDFVNVVDLNEAHILAADHLLDGGKSQVLNLGTGSGNSVLEIVAEVENQTGKKLDFSHGKIRAGDPAKLIASIDKARKVLGWQPRRTIKDSINSLFTWYKNHPHGWDR